jgi:intracellular septation protein A
MCTCNMHLKSNLLLIFFYNQKTRTLHESKFLGVTTTIVNIVIACIQVYTNICKNKKTCKNASKYKNIVVGMWLKVLPFNKIT